MSELNYDYPHVKYRGCLKSSSQQWLYSLCLTPMPSYVTVGIDVPLATEAKAWQCKMFKCGVKIW